MNLLTVLGRRQTEPPTLDKRIEAARACRYWQEIDGSRLEQRERRFLVDTESGERFERYPGDAFSPSGAIVADMTPLVFYVADDALHILERADR